ncbi:MAG: hypothetical protein Aurels2KO_39780 [Aureliella sp.]
MTVLSARAKDTYMELVREFPLVAIQDDKHLTAAQRILDELLQQALNRGGEAYVEVLSDLIGDYEDEHHPISASSPVEMLRHLMDTHSLSQADVCRDIGAGKSTLSQFLSGKRELSKSTAKKLADYFEVELSLFL